MEFKDVLDFGMYAGASAGIIAIGHYARTAVSVGCLGYEALKRYTCEAAFWSREAYDTALQQLSADPERLEEKIAEVRQWRISEGKSLHARALCYAIFAPAVELAIYKTRRSLEEKLTE